MIGRLIREHKDAKRRVPCLAEYELLRVLSLNAGRVSTYDALLRQVWDGRHGADGKIVRAYVKRLCSRLGDDARHPVYLQTELRVGCRMPGPDDI